jgi:hypothetical protein
LFNTENGWECSGTAGSFISKDGGFQKIGMRANVIDDVSECKTMKGNFS